MRPRATVRLQVTLPLPTQRAIRIPEAFTTCLVPPLVSDLMLFLSVWIIAGLLSVEQVFNVSSTNSR